MKPAKVRISLSACVLALAFSASLAGLPAAAATSQPAPPAPLTATDKATAPYTIKVGTTECPVIPKGSSLSPTTQRLFDTLTDACLMKASGVITDSQFEAIRDEAVGYINMQLATEMSEAMSPSPPALASNQ